MLKTYLFSWNFAAVQQVRNREYLIMTVFSR